ncbi:uncharacterized protein LOC109068605 [Cyprinus carpio]|uniref:Uncharacterized protein LOC109068605 n=1 Tax=Cyprinus carpio TaxID=7962 RepID=A0A9Q9WX30_CYPCA|nr:uncharacterized protein LOC109068605 [Cyprinus carpio]
MEIPKRIRNPIKKRKVSEPVTALQNEEQEGLYVFLTFEDGYTARICKTCDILTEKESPITSFEGLIPGARVLARWSDNKFYNATVDHIGFCDQKQDPRKGAKKDIKRNYASAESFYNQNRVASAPAEHGPSSALTQPPSPGLPPTQHQSVQLPCSVKPFNPQPMTPSEYCNQDQPGFLDLDEHQRQTITHNSTPKETFLGLLYNPSIPHPSAEVTIQDDQLGLEPEEYEDPTVRSQNSSYENEQWEPCETCKLEVQALLKENKMMKDVLSSMNLEHLQVLREFIDKMEDYKSRESGVLMPQTRPGQQELYPDSGLLLSSTKLAAIHQESKKDCLRLFHLLFDQFFTHEECSNSVAFGKHGKVPEGKTILDKSKVNGILTYVMSCGKCHGWKPVEKSKLKKALINKCRMRST